MGFIEFYILDDARTADETVRVQTVGHINLDSSVDRSISPVRPHEH